VDEEEGDERIIGGKRREGKCKSVSTT